MVVVPIHVTAGLLAIGAGAVALYAVKGEWLHRRSGMAFVIAMLVMASTGAVMAALKPDRGTALGGAMVFYIVCTGVLTAAPDLVPASAGQSLATASQAIA